MMDDVERIVACGGCGEADPSKRCLGCLHDFGDAGSAWVHSFNHNRHRGLMRNVTFQENPDNA